jgi:flagellar biosynthesis protein FlhB
MPSDRKTEKPTARRLRKARREGDHPVSKLLVGFGALALLSTFAPFALQALFESARQGLADALSGAAPPTSRLAFRVGVLAGPLLGAAALGAWLVGLWQTRGVFSVEPLRWDLRRLNPFGRRGQGLGTRVFAVALALAAGLSMCGAAWLVMRDMGAALAHSVGDGRAAIRLAVESCRRLGWWALGVSLVFAIIDGIFRFIAWIERHRMTADEVRQEQRENQGDPELRQARRRVHQELANAGAARELGRASLLVIGAPELAVALSYDPHRDIAPRVLLSGSGPMAASLAALAASLGVPVEHDTALAHALAAVPIDHEVPPARYADIARALQRAGMFRPAGPQS